MKRYGRTIKLEAQNGHRGSAEARADSGSGAQITQEKLLVNPEAEQKAQAVGDNSRPDENALLKEGEADPSPAAEPGSQELHTSLPMQAEGSAWDHFAASLDAAEREALCRALARRICGRAFRICEKPPNHAGGAGRRHQ